MTTTTLLRTACAIGAGLLASGFAAPASAQLVDELRLGIAEHDFEINQDDTRESGVNIQPQIVFRSPLPNFLEPQPYLIASINSDDETNFYGGGILFKQGLFSDEWFWELDGGIVWHDGRTDLPPPIEAEERMRILATEITFGAETLFHFIAGVGREINDDWDAQVYFEHLSTGQVFGDDTKNEGVENIGIKIAYKL